MRSAGGQGSCPRTTASGPSLPGPRPRSSLPSLKSSSAMASRAERHRVAEVRRGHQGAEAQARWSRPPRRPARERPHARDRRASRPSGCGRRSIPVANPTSSAHSHWRRASDHRSLGRMTSPTRMASNVAVPATVAPVANESETRRWNHPRWVAAWPQGSASPTPSLPTWSRRSTLDRVSGFSTSGVAARSLAITLADAVAPEGEVVGFDISSALLELARRRAAEAGRSNVRFVDMDVQTGTLELGPFDLAVSQFGVMFFDEPTAALAAIKLGWRRTGASSSPAGRASSETRGMSAQHCGLSCRHRRRHRRGRARSARSPSATRSTCASCWKLPVSGPSSSKRTRPPCAARPRSVTDPSLFGLMGLPPDREEEATARLEAHLAHFAIGPGEFEYPLAFMDLRGDGVAVSSSWPATAAPPWPRSWESQRGRRSPCSVAPPAGVIEDLPPGVRVKRQARGTADVVVAFFTERRVFERRLGALGEMVFPSGGLWLAWPKRASGWRLRSARTWSASWPCRSAWLTTRCAPSTTPGPACGWSGVANVEFCSRASRAVHRHAPVRGEFGWASKATRARMWPWTPRHRRWTSRIR